MMQKLFPVALLTGLLLCGAVIPVQPTQTAAPSPSSQPALRLKPVNFNDPPREYETACLAKWNVLVERQLTQENPALAERALAKLERQLDDLFTRLPAHSHADLRKIQLFVMYGSKARGGGRSNGLEYFQRIAPKYFRNLDPRMASAILIYSAENYVWLPDDRSLMVLAHEFGHAYHLEHWPEKQPDILNAWVGARMDNLYEHVVSKDGQQTLSGYAAVNQLEYFAELSAVYFVGGYYHPRTRDDLKKHDPEGFKMIEKMWRLR